MLKLHHHFVSGYTPIPKSWSLNLWIFLKNFEPTILIVDLRLLLTLYFGYHLKPYATAYTSYLLWSYSSHVLFGPTNTLLTSIAPYLLLKLVSSLLKLAFTWSSEQERSNRHLSRGLIRIDCQSRLENRFSVIACMHLNLKLSARTTMTGSLFRRVCVHENIIWRKIRDRTYHCMLKTLLDTPISINEQLN